MERLFQKIDEKEEKMRVITPNAGGDEFRGNSI